MIIDRRLVRTDWEKRRRFLSYEKLRAYIPNGFSVHFPHPLAAVSAALPFFPTEARGGKPALFILIYCIGNTASVKRGGVSVMF